MRVLGITGWSGSGKTGLICRLIPELAGRGFSVSSIKHGHHDFDIDRPGKDSYRHREAGAREVMVGSARRWALMHELRGEPEPELDELLARLSPVDLVLVEGFKRDRHPKIEVYRPATGDAPMFAERDSVVAVATDAALDPAAFGRPGLDVLDLNDAAIVADFVERLAAPLRSVS